MARLPLWCVPVRRPLVSGFPTLEHEDEDDDDQQQAGQADRENCTSHGAHRSFLVGEVSRWSLRRGRRYSVSGARPNRRVPASRYGMNLP